VTEVRPAAPFSNWERTLAFRYLRAKRKNGGVTLISVISFTAIALAVATLIVVMSIMNGFRTELLNRMLGFNGHAYVAGDILYKPAAERDADVARIDSIIGVSQATPMVESQALVMGPSQQAGVIVRGVTPKGLVDIRMISENIRQGSLNGFGEGEYGGDLIVIGSGLAQITGVNVGGQLTIVSPSGPSTPFGSAPTSKAYTVGAVFSVGMAEYDQAFIYMPLEQAQELFGKTGMVDVVELMVADPDRLDEMLPAIARAAGKGAVVTDWREKNKQFWGALQVERNAMRIILLLIIGIAALNIISGLVMLVKNKSRDIAILRTIGAGQGAVMRIFLMSGAAVGVLATPAGLAIGLLICLYISEIQNFLAWVTGAQVINPSIYLMTTVPALIDWSEVWIVTFWTLAMSVATTLLPAWRASRIDPVEALRYE